mgnify:CR=1 FL=1
MGVTSTHSQSLVLLPLNSSEVCQGSLESKDSTRSCGEQCSIDVRVTQRWCLNKINVTNNTDSGSGSGSGQFFVGLKRTASRHKYLIFRFCVWFVLTFSVHLLAILCEFFFRLPQLLHRRGKSMEISSGVATCPPCCIFSVLSSLQLVGQSLNLSGHGI